MLFLKRARPLRPPVSYSYHSRILSYFVATSSCCILLLCVLLGTFFFYKLNALTASYNDLLLRNARIELQKTLEQIGSNSVQMCINKKVNRYLSTGPSVDYSDIADIQALVADMSTANDYTDSVYIVYPERNMVVSSFGVYDYDTFTDLGWRKATAEREGPLVWLGTRTIMKDRMTQVPSRVATLVVQMPLYRRDHVGYLVYNIRESFLRSHLAHTQQNEEEGGFILLVDASGTLVTCNADTDAAGFDTLYQDILRQTQAGNVNRIVSVGDTMAILSMAGTPVNDWRFITYTPIGNSLRDTLTTISFIAILALMVIVVAYLFARHVSRKICEPVSQLLRSTSSSDTTAHVPTFHFEEFRRISENVADILREKDSLQEKISGLLPSLRDKFFSELLNDQIQENDYLREYMEFLGIDPNATCQYNVFVLRIDNYEGYAAETSHETRALTKLSICEFIRNLCARNDLFCHMIEPTPRRIAVVSGFSNDYDVKENVFMLSGNITSYVEKNYPFTVTIGIGNPVSELTALHTTYAQALEALDYRFVYGENQIILFQNVQDAPSFDFLNPLLYEKSLLGAIKTANHHEIATILCKINASICSSAYAYKINSIRQIYASILNMVFAAAGELAAYSSDGRQLHGLIRTINATEALDGIHTLVQNTCMDISRGYEQKRAAKTKKVSEDILTYLRENYSRDISLTDLSNTILYTPAYINKLLRTDTQKTFYDLLTEIRMEKARELLNEGLQIGEVSDRVGYANVQSFIRMFKKTMGVTPGRYKDSAATQEEQ